MAYAFLFFLLLIFSFNIILENIHACNQSERSSLLSFSLTLSSPQLNWTSFDCCNWEGITCNQDGWITHLQLPSKGLKLKEGTFLSSSLGNLTHLTHLNLSHNSLYGSLDQSTGFFSSLNHLEILDLSYNLLSGELPSSLPSQNIRKLDLSSNHLHGAIPTSFFQKALNLTSFNVSNNTFSGSIPSSICLHSSPLIRLLDFSFNEFSGKISQGLGECSKLHVFRAGHNDLSGLLSDDIYNATTVEEISLPHNSLDGAIGERIANLTNLSILDLNSNVLTGVLPESIGKLSKLKLLLLQFNNLEGSLPPSLMNCTSLAELNMGFNNLEGNISELNFSRLISLSKLDIGKNHLTGMFPVSLYSCKYLKAIRLSGNDLEGEIQPEILSLKSLSFLSLGYNRMTNIAKAMKILMHCKNLVVLSLASNFVGEEFPDDLGVVDFDGFQNLRMLVLRQCELTGQLPIWLSKVKKLKILALESNRITGIIPSWLGTLPRLFFIQLDNNQISGEFPKELCKLPMLVSESSTAQDDDIYLELPIYGYQSPTLRQYKLFSSFPPAINIGNNTISGNIPTEIGQLQLLRTLSLSNNNFSGNIPEQLSDLKNLENLDLSMNHLSGKIPLSLTSLNFLSSFNVSYNNLEGGIPTSTQLQSFNASAFEGNPKLCGPPLSNECLPNPNKGIKKEKNNNQYLVDINGQQIPWLSVVLGFIVGFLGVCSSIYMHIWKMYTVCDDNSMYAATVAR
ncbi:PREDICTED: receptor-like protein 2 [Fragaria vesca subsp. vesca]|uniref:receptor-like protein 2 n=1 Tax=Fragaria vesca subsp. vesca TaxID=101020 RepID=UPI0002C32ED4|nr:PREDICTED: receptor-like protein 2 [Fragaria vesca subsp. vesca]